MTLALEQPLPWSGRAVGETTPQNPPPETLNAYMHIYLSVICTFQKVNIIRT